MTSRIRLPYLLAGASLAAVAYVVDLEGYARIAPGLELLAMAALLLSMAKVRP